MHIMRPYRAAIRESICTHLMMRFGRERQSLVLRLFMKQVE